MPSLCRIVISFNNNNNNKSNFPHSILTVLIALFVHLSFLSSFASALVIRADDEGDDSGADGDGDDDPGDGPDGCSGPDPGPGGGPCWTNMIETQSANNSSNVRIGLFVGLLGLFLTALFTLAFLRWRHLRTRALKNQNQNSLRNSQFTAHRPIATYRQHQHHRQMSQNSFGSSASVRPLTRGLSNISFQFSLNVGGGGAGAGGGLTYPAPTYGSGNRNGNSDVRGIGEGWDYDVTSGFAPPFRPPQRPNGNPTRTNSNSNTLSLSRSTTTSSTVTSSRWHVTNRVPDASEDRTDPDGISPLPPYSPPSSQAQGRGVAVYAPCFGAEKE